LEIQEMHVDQLFSRLGLGAVFAWLVIMTPEARADFINHATSRASVNVTVGKGIAMVETHGVDNPAIAEGTVGEEDIVEDPFQAFGSATARVTYQPESAGFIGDRLGFHLDAHAHHIEGESGGATANASASFTDHFQVTVLPFLFGNPLHEVRARLHVTGNLNALMTGARIQLSRGNDVELSTYTGPHPIIDEFVALSIDGFTPRSGLPELVYDVSFELTAQANALASSLFTSGSANFGSTITLEGFDFLDSNGAYLPVSLVSDSGVKYGVNPSLAAVPEPSSLSILGIGLTTIAGAGWIRRAAARRAGPARLTESIDELS
jgi:hypothetical protein